MTSDIDLKAFELYKEKHPDFFPEGTSIEKQHAYFLMVSRSRIYNEKERNEKLQNLDSITEHGTRQQELRKVAKELYESGMFIDYCINTFQKIWMYDVHILKAMMYIATSFIITNPEEGIHTSVTGTTQSGKSDSVKTALKFVPQYYQLIKTFSPKWIFYAEEELHKNIILFSDDTQLDEEVAGLFRGILTSWNTGSERGIVDNKKARTLKVPPHVSLILTNVDGVVEETKEGQDESRFLVLEVRRNPDQDTAIKKFIQSPKVNIDKELELIYAVWDQMVHHDVVIHKEVDLPCTIREFKRYMTLIRCNALLRNRTTTTDDDFNEINQFLTYSKPMIDAQTPAHKRDEEAILSVLTSNWKAVDTICKETNLSYLRVVRAIRGTTGTFDNPSGGLLNDKLVKMDYVPETRKYSFSRVFIN